MYSRHSVVATLFCCLSCQSAFAEITNCTPITSLPFVISAPGIYCLTGDLQAGALRSATGPKGAIEIAADFVTVDLNGRRIDMGWSDVWASSAGVHAYGHHHLAVRNGTIRGGTSGVRLEIGSDNIVEGIGAYGSTESGIDVSSSNSIIRDNRIDVIGGANPPSGIRSWGAGNSIINNTISTSAPVPAYGSGTVGVFSRGDQSAIVGNRILNMAVGSGGVMGIWTTGADQIIAGNYLAVRAGMDADRVGIRTEYGAAVVHDNVITGFTEGIAMLGGGAYSGNSVVGAINPYIGSAAHGAMNTP
jgi:hypothetical protein